MVRGLDRGLAGGVLVLSSAWSILLRLIMIATDAVSEYGGGGVGHVGRTGTYHAWYIHSGMPVHIVHKWMKLFKPLFLLVLLLVIVLMLSCRRLGKGLT